MGDSLAKGSLYLDVQGAKFDSDISRSQEAIRKFFAAANGQKFQMPKFAVALGQGNFIGALSPQLAGAVVAAKTAFNSIISTFQETRRTIGQARNLGFSTQFFGGLQLQAREVGVDLEDAGHGWRHYQETLAEAMQGNARASSLFSRLGVDIEHIGSMSQQDIFKRLGDGVAAMNNPLDRAVAQIGLFGSRGAQLGRTLFRGGSQGMEQSQATASRLGISLTEPQALAAEAAIKAWNSAAARVGGAWDAMWRNVQIQAAPILESLAEALNGSVEQTGTRQISTLEALPRAAEMVAVQIAEAFSGALMRLTQYVLETVETLTKAAQLLPEALGGGQNGWAKAASDGVRRAANNAINMANARENGDWVHNLEESRRRSDLRITNMIGRDRPDPSAQLANKAADFLAKLQEENEGFGQSTEQIERNRLARGLLAQQRAQDQAAIINPQNFAVIGPMGAMGGAYGIAAMAAEAYSRAQTKVTSETIRNIDAQLKLKQALKDQQEKKAADSSRGVAITQENESPHERFMRERQELDALYKSGSIGLDTYSRGMSRSFHQLSSSIGETKLPEMQAFGSKEAVETIQRYKFGGAEKPEDAVRRVLEASQQIEKEQRDLQKRMLDALLEQVKVKDGVQEIQVNVI